MSAPITLQNFRPVTNRDHALWRASQPDYWRWLRHVMPAAGCTQPIRLAGALHTIDGSTGQILSTAHTADMPDGVIYKACGNRRGSRLPRLRPHLPTRRLPANPGRPGRRQRRARVGRHPRHPVRHLHRPQLRRRPHPSRHQAHLRQPAPLRLPTQTLPPGPTLTCPHGVDAVCFARHDPADPRLGQPLCVDCYDYDAQVVWNIQAGYRSRSCK